MRSEYFLMGCFLGGVGAGLFPVRADAARTKPNILFAVADDWSYGHAEVYGCPWIKMPAFDRLAQQGLLFNHACTPCGKCAPSRASIITGRNPWQLKAAANHWCYFPPEFKSVVEVLSEHGYFTGMTGKGWAPGVATNTEGELRQMTGRPFQKRKLKPPTSFISNDDYAANFRDFLDEAPKGQPWFFWYGSWEPHRPYEYGSGAVKGGMKPPTLTMFRSAGRTTRRCAWICWIMRSRPSILTSILV